MLNSLQTDLEVNSIVQPIEPKNERDAKVEEIELNPKLKMGTFEIVNIAVDTIPSLFRFTDKLMREQVSKIGKHKARLAPREDMQTEDPYSTTYAPTSRITPVCTINIQSLATHQYLAVEQWDITDAFMTADIDTDLYLDLPPGDHFAPGESINLRKK
jgi:DNA polymerase III alpha subunit (gram-positive type)